MADEQTADFFNPPADAPPETPEAPPAGDEPILMGPPPTDAPDFAAPPPAEEDSGFIGDVDATGGDVMHDAVIVPEPPAVAEEEGMDVMMGFAAPAPEDAGAEPVEGGEAVEAADADADALLPEPEPVEPAGPTSAMTKWNEEWQVTLKDRKDGENSKKAETIEQARVDMETFNSARDTKRETKMAKNRSDEQDKLEAIEADLENDNSWQKACKLVEMQHDTVEAGADVGRMKDVMILLKNEPTRAEVLTN